MNATQTDTALSAGPRLRHHAAVALLYCALTVIMVYPVARDPFGRTAGGEGDNTFCVHQFWWMKRALVDLHTTPFFDPSTYYPVGRATVNGELDLATTIPGIPLTAAGGPVFAYNMTLLFTFAMTGLGTYLWMLKLTRSMPGSIIAGIVAAFLPYRFAHLGGHLNMMSTHWVPWALYAFESFLERKRVVRGAALGVCVALVVLSSWYYGYATALMLPIYALVRSRPWRENWDAAWWRGLAAGALVAAVLVLPFLAPYLSLRVHGGLTRGIDEMDSWSINFYDFFLPNRLNPAFSAFAIKWFHHQAAQWVECGVALGYTALGLSLIGLTRRGRNRPMTALLVVWAASFAIALGPTMHIGNRQVLLPVPVPMAALAARITGMFGSLATVHNDILASQSLPIPLPAMFMFLFVPMTSGMRVMSRFGMWTGLMTAGLAGWGAALLVEAVRRRAANRPLTATVLTAILVAALGGLVLAESYSSITTIELRPREVDRWLARQPTAPVAELPVEQALRPLQDYYLTVHGQPTVFGLQGDSFAPPIFAQRRAALADFPSDRSVALLRSWHVRYVLLTPASIPGWPALKRRVEAQPGVRYEREIGGVLVYGLDQVNGATAAPFGQIDTPAQNATGVQGAIGIAGWALDDVGVTDVKIYRNCFAFENQANCQTVGGHSVAYLGDATFVPGARPDVEAAFSNQPQAHRSGWGYLLSTNMLPHVPRRLAYGGQGQLTIYAFATDVEGHLTLLGRSQGDHTPTTIAMANDTIARPFGAIDTPTQGGTASGTFANFGWAVTPDDGGGIDIPTSGSTMRAFIDGVAVANVSYNQCRGNVGNPVPDGLYCNDDVASILGNATPQPSFTRRTSNPTRYRNLDAGRAAIGACVFDTTTFANGVHTIAWSVTDSAGRVEAIGSRYFTVLNGSHSPAMTGSQSAVGPLRPARVVRARTGFDLASGWDEIPADKTGIRRIRVPELGRLELSLGPVETGHLVANGTGRDLPAGSRLDPATGQFTWMPGPAYLGTYRLAFVRGNEQVLVDVTIGPPSQSAPRPDADKHRRERERPDE